VPICATDARRLPGVPKSLDDTDGGCVGWPFFRMCGPTFEGPPPQALPMGCRPSRDFTAFSKRRERAVQLCARSWREVTGALARDAARESAATRKNKRLNGDFAFH
jgi:hypothetical protein